MLYLSHKIKLHQFLEVLVIAYDYAQMLELKVKFGLAFKSRRSTTPEAARFQTLFDLFRLIK
jgi:hypothetical protein